MSSTKLKMIDNLGTSVYQSWRVIPYNLMDVKLWAVESLNGYIYKYCNSREDALKYVDELRVGSYEI